MDGVQTRHRRLLDQPGLGVFRLVVRSLAMLLQAGWISWQCRSEFRRKCPRMPLIVICVPQE